MQVFLIAAITADGFIGQSKSHRSFNWTSEEDKQFYVSKIKEAGVIVMGAQTFSTFTKYPRGCTYVVYTRRPEEFINPKPQIIETIATSDAPADLLTQLEQRGHTQVAVSGGASIYTLFMKAAVVDTIYLTVEPVLFGEGVRMFSEPIDSQIELADVQQLSDQTTLLKYKVLK